MPNKYALNNIPHRWMVIGLTVLYAVFVAWVSTFHEVWRDEVVPLSIVSDSHSLGEVIGKIRDFGHPALWYVLVYFAHQLLSDPVALKILNILICVLAVYLFLDKAPFDRAKKILFIGGYFPLYFYPIINRNYGISFLLVILICILYKDRWKKVLPLSIVLFLMAHVHAHSLIIALAVIASMAYEIVFASSDKRREMFGKGKALIGLTVALLGTFTSLSNIMPQHNSVLFSTDSLTVVKFFEAAWRAVLIPGYYFFALFGYDNAMFVNVIILAFYIYLVRNKKLLVLFFAGVCGLALFFELIYYTQEIRHQVPLYLLMLMVLWMDTQADPDINKGKFQLVYRISDVLAVHKRNFVIFLLILQVLMAYPAIKNDILSPYSASKGLANIIHADPKLREAIIMAAPEAVLEALPYYLDNPLYFYTEDAFGKYRHFLYKGRDVATLAGLLRRAEDLQEEHKKPIIILLGHQVRPEGPYQFTFTHQAKTFKYSKTDLSLFYLKTTFLERFEDSLTDENYAVYLLD